MSKSMRARPHVIDPAEFPGHQRRGQQLCQQSPGDLQAQAVQHSLVGGVKEAAGKLVDRHPAGLLLLPVYHIEEMARSQSLAHCLHPEARGRQAHAEAVLVSHQNGVIESGLVQVGQGQLLSRHLHDDILRGGEVPLAQLLDEELGADLEGLVSGEGVVGVVPVPVSLLL